MYLPYRAASTHALVSPKAMRSLAGANTIPRQAKTKFMGILLSTVDYPKPSVSGIVSWLFGHLVFPLSSTVTTVAIVVSRPFTFVLAFSSSTRDDVLRKQQTNVALYITAAFPTVEPSTEECRSTYFLPHSGYLSCVGSGASLGIVANSNVPTLSVNL